MKNRKIVSFCTWNACFYRYIYSCELKIYDCFSLSLSLPPSLSLSTISKETNNNQKQNRKISLWYLFIIWERSRENAKRSFSNKLSQPASSAVDPHHQSPSITNACIFSSVCASFREAVIKGTQIQLYGSFMKTIGLFSAMLKINWINEIRCFIPLMLLCNEELFWV